MPSLLVSRSCVTDVIADHASACPDRPAVIFPGDTADTELSFASVAGRGWAQAGWLREQLPPGSRVMLALPTGPEFVTAFVGCLAAGMIAVPTPIPDNRHNARRRTASVARDSGTAMVLAGDTNLADLQDWAGASGLDLRCATVPDLAPCEAPPAGLRRPDLATWPSSSTPPARPATPRASWSATPTSWPTPRCTPGTRPRRPAPGSAAGSRSTTIWAWWPCCARRCCWAALPC